MNVAVEVNRTLKQVEVAIVGAGFGGICMAIKLQQAGIRDLVILEKSAALGGTWRDNTYPGCACDVQSHLYSFSFAGNPDWSMRYAGWKEIQAYIHDTAYKFKLRQYLQYNAEVEAAQFSESTGRWLLTLASGEKLSARHFILATGPLHVPSIPDLPGLEDFRGKVMHSAQWDHGYELKGKKIVSIGTGASAIQYLPEIAPEVDKLTVFQRTPAWVIPRDMRSYSVLRKRLFAKLPLLRKLHRLRLYLSNEIRVLPILHSRLANAFQFIARFHLNRQVKNPELNEKLTPNYTIGCKRLLISNAYYPMFNRDNVELVANGIKEVKQHSVIDGAGKEYPTDAILLGTGFVTDPRIYMKDFTLTGLPGRDIHEDWRHGAEAYYGITVAGYPNMFQLVGPNTGLGHNSMIYMIENQVDYVVKCVLNLKQKKASYMSLKPAVQKQFNEQLQQRLVGTVWVSGCKSWYQQADGRNVVIWPGTTLRYHRELKNASMDVYNWCGDETNQASLNTSEILAAESQTEC